MLGFMTIVPRGRKEAGNLRGALVLQLALAAGKGTTRNRAGMEAAVVHSHINFILLQTRRCSGEDTEVSCQVECLCFFFFCFF